MMRDELRDPIRVEFPLRGEWVAVTSPGDRIPSHGTDMLGQRFAYDFLRTDSRRHFHPAGTLKTLILGVPTRECYAWGQQVHLPFDGEIVETRDGYPERSRVVPLREAALAMRNAASFDVGGDLRPLVGNYVVARSGDTFAVFAHLASGSILVTPGQRIRTGEVIGRVGHSGNSTSPHLHFQLMDGPDPRQARGIPAAFDRLEVEQPDGWAVAHDVVPRGRQRIRYAPRTEGEPHLHR